MKRKLYLDIALLVVILGGFGVFVSMQHAPATDIPTQEAADAPATGCCGDASKVEGDTSQVAAGGCCGTPASETVQSENALQQTQKTSEPDKTVSETPPNEEADEGGCGCGG